MRSKPARLLLVSALLVGAVAASAAPAGANNTWGGYHWSRSANPLGLDIVDSMTADWDARLAMVNADWNVSSVLENEIVPGTDDRRTRKQCRAIPGKIRSCNAEYGFNGWLGIATIHVSGKHIVDGTAKMNDSYFNRTATYNTEEARRHVACQEIGHLFGLDHQHGEYGPTCMDDVSGLNDPDFVSPNQHDYDMLASIYAHSDGGTQAAPSAEETPGQADPSVFVHREGDDVYVTFVFWAR